MRAHHEKHFLEQFIFNKKKIFLGKIYFQKNKKGISWSNCLFRGVSISRTYPGQLFGWTVTVSVSPEPHIININSIFPNCIFKTEFSQLYFPLWFKILIRFSFCNSATTTPMFSICKFQWRSTSALSNTYVHAHTFIKWIGRGFPNGCETTNLVSIRLFFALFCSFLCLKYLKVGKGCKSWQ